MTTSGTDKHQDKGLTIILSALLFALVSISVIADDAESEKTADESISEFFNTYFQSFSDSDFKTFKSLFHPQARVIYYDRNQVYDFGSLNDFFKAQESFQAAQNTVEIATSTEITQKGPVVSAIIGFEIIGKDYFKKGYDHFHLVKGESNQWQIVQLIFHNT